MDNVLKFEPRDSSKTYRSKYTAPPKMSETQELIKAMQANTKAQLENARESRLLREALAQESAVRSSRRHARRMSETELHDLLGVESEEMDDTPFEPTPGVIPMDEEFDPEDY